MAPNEKLAQSLSTLRRLQAKGKSVFRSSELSRTDRERLLRNGFLQDVIKGWVISSSPRTLPGDSTPWYASFWEFCASYCEARFGEHWHISPEQSLLLHAENTVIPAQAVISSPLGSNNKTELPYGTSIYDLKTLQMPTAADLALRSGLRVFQPEAALVRASNTFFSRNPIESQVVLASLRDVSEILRRLLDGGHTVTAGRLAGALRHMGRLEEADEIVITMRAAGHAVRESDPFDPHQPTTIFAAATPPIVGRIRSLWANMRHDVLSAFPKAPGLPRDVTAYLHSVDEIYKADAYHSLSIEGYTVTMDLIDRVRAGNWDPDSHEADGQNRDALAARGYWQAFQLVKGDVASILRGKNAGQIAKDRHRDWYRELFQPCVSAGLVAPSALAGYRNDAVYLRTSRYVPPRWEAVRDAMPALFELLRDEPEPGVRAVLGHWMFGYIHPYPDGNGRMARFLMNAMLASGGYNWTIIRVEDRTEYLATLDQASIFQDIGPFARFVAERTIAVHGT